MKNQIKLTYSRFNIFCTWKEIVINLKQNWELVKQLLILSLTRQYKKTFLGSSWLFIQPIIGIIVWIILHSSGVYSPGDSTIPYPAYILLSMSIWTFFANFFKNIGTSVTESGRMLMEVAFPLEIKIVERTLFTIINFSIPLCLSIIVLLVLGVELQLSSLLFIPAIIPLMLFGIAISVFFSLLEVVFNDMFLIVNQGLGLLMYLTPVVYTKNVDSELLQLIIKYNPLSYLISIPRDILTGTTITDWNGYWISVLFVVILFIVVIQFFILSAKKIIEKILE